jgi:putative endonuclease
VHLTNAEMAHSSYLQGQEAENLALHWFLQNRPARLLARNFRIRGGEIDLIFEEHSQTPELVFVEVRMRALEGWVNGAESLSQSKQKHLKRAIEMFLLTYRGPAQALRVDLLSWDGKSWTHIPNLRIID